MESRSVDYDAIAVTYNRRFKQNQKRETSITLRELVQELPARQILEVGCGTGQWLSDLLTGPIHQPSSPLQQLYGLDPSLGMLEQAQGRRIGLHLVRGHAECLPFIDQHFDLVFCVNAIHHFNQPGDFITESRRILRPGGVLAIVGMDPRGHCDNWYVYQYFEGTFETDLARYPSWGMILDWVVSSGFEHVTWQLAEHISDPKVGSAVFHDPFLDKNAASQLTLLSDEEYTTGLRKIHDALSKADKGNETLLFPVEFYLHMLTAKVPAV
jgi:ubiquinone/menaquinone biosynthesis C-methylase UbiE